MDEHVTNLKEVAFDARERKRIHAIAEVVPHARVVVLVQIAHGDPFAEERRVEESDQPAALAAATAALAGQNRSGNLSWGRVVRFGSIQSEEPHHRGRS